MKLILTVFAASVASVAAAFGQSSIVVRSGEHADFSRLVIDEPLTESWSLQSYQDHAVIVLNGVDAKFDTGKVFDLIPRTRVAELESLAKDGGSALVIRFACECHVEAFETTGRRIVADIKFGALPNITAFEPTSPLTDVEPHSESAAIENFSDPSSLFAQSRLDFPRLESGIEAEISPVIVLKNDIIVPEERAAAQESTVADATNAQNPDANLDSEVAKAQRELFAQLARSIDQGIIEVVDPVESTARSDESIGIDEPEPNNEMIAGHVDRALRDDDVAVLEATPTDSSAEVDASQHLAAQTVLDRDSPQTHAAAGSEIRNCLPQSDFEIAAWAEDKPLFEQLANLNSKILGEFDQPDAEIITRLARLYVHYGFGMEARALLLQFGSEIPDTPLLMDLSEIVEERPIANDGPVMRNIGCENSADLWASLATGQIQPPNVDGTDKILAEVTKLPTDLRRLVGPRIGAILLAANKTDAADKLLYMIKRSAGVQGADYELFEALVANALGNLSEARSIFEKLVGSNSPNRPAALVELAALTVNRKEPASADLIEDVSATAVILGGTAIGKQLRLAEIRLRAGSNNLADALRLFRTEIAPTNNYSVSDRDLLIELFLAADATRESDANYATAVLENADLIGDGPAFRGVRLDVGEKLRVIGLAADALTFLAPLLDANEPDAKIVAATAELDLSHPDQTLSWLAGMYDPDSAALRLRALLALPTVSSEPADAQDFPELAWPLGDWKTAAKSENEDTRQLAEFMLARSGEAAVPQQPINPTVVSRDRQTALFGIEPSPEPQITLAIARQLLTDQAIAKAQVEKVLAAAEATTP